MFPRKIVCDVICWNWECERTTLSITFGHNFQESSVNHIHFRLQITVCEIYLFFTNKWTLFAQIFRASPIKCEIDKRCLCSPTAWHRAIEHQCLHRIFNICIRHFIQTNIRCQICVNRRESLSARKFVLQSSQEIHHMRNRGCHMFCRFALQITFDPVESFI